MLNRPPFHLIITNSIHFASDQVSISPSVLQRHNRQQGLLLAGTRFRVVSLDENVRGHRPTSYETMIAGQLHGRESHILGELIYMYQHTEVENISLI
jgi:hypothetical protein